MKKSKIVAGISALAISFSAFSAPQVLAQEPGNEPVTEEEKQQGAQEISFADSDGAEILPEETLTFTADDWEPGIEMRNAYIELAPGVSTTLWDVERSTSEDGAPQVIITAPTEPEEQSTSTPQEYGEYLVHIRTSNWNSVYFNINFVEERTTEEESIWDRLIQLSSNLSS